MTVSRNKYYTLVIFFLCEVANLLMLETLNLQWQSLSWRTVLFLLSIALRGCISVLHMHTHKCKHTHTLSMAWGDLVCG